MYQNLKKKNLNTLSLLWHLAGQSCMPSARKPWQFLCVILKFLVNVLLYSRKILILSHRVELHAKCQTIIVERRKVEPVSSGGISGRSSSASSHVPGSTTPYNSAQTPTYRLVVLCITDSNSFNCNEKFWKLRISNSNIY